MFNKILVAYDGSDNARCALDVASEFSKKLGADLNIVHVLMHGRPSQELVRMAKVEHLVQEAYTTVLPGVPYAAGQLNNLLGDSASTDQTARVVSALDNQLVSYAKSRSTELGARHVKTLVRTGDYADEILDTANEHNADMIVIGSRGLGKITQTILGSVSQKVLHHAGQTVVVVK